MLPAFLLGPGPPLLLRPCSGSSSEKRSSSLSRASWRSLLRRSRSLRYFCFFSRSIGSSGSVSCFKFISKKSRPSDAIQSLLTPYCFCMFFLSPQNPVSDPQLPHNRAYCCSGRDHSFWNLPSAYWNNNCNSWICAYRFSA